MKALQRDILRDRRYPVHQIADQLEPYLELLVERFQPEQVVLFGSYAYGHPDRDSDIDLLVVMPLQQSPLKEAIAIRRAWRPLRRQGGALGFDLLVESPQEHRRRREQKDSWHEEICQKGLRIW
jgi:predicted nucleotidyltransferase